MYESVRLKERQKVDKLDIQIRGYRPEDKNIILKTWLMGYQQMMVHTPAPLYFEQQQRLIFSIARKARIALACDRSMPAFVLGFVVAFPRKKPDDISSPLIVHYGWTRQNYRRMGIMKLALYALGWRENVPIHLTQWMHRAKDLRARFNIIHNPYPIMDITREQRIPIAHHPDRV